MPSREVILCSDFGSTYTKLCAIDLRAEKVLGTSLAPTSLDTQLMEAYEEALAFLEAAHGPFKIVEQMACSSAAGGLRMRVAGLVPELTAQAAQYAALGAGAKVEKSYAHRLSKADLAELEAADMDIFLLVGGTDGGDRACILENAKALARIKLACPIVVAGNRDATDEIAERFEAAGLRYRLCPNLLPSLGSLQVEPVQAEIRQIFLEQIVEAKGLDAMQKRVRSAIIPTPSAVLEAIRLLAEGQGELPGWGDFLAVDLGGATTDVYSAGRGLPAQANTVLKGLEEPYLKRSVEGDLGMRHSLEGILEATSVEALAEASGFGPLELEAMMLRYKNQAAALPDTPELLALDARLAEVAVATALGRHVGQLEEVYTPLGRAYAQRGKDLRHVKRVLCIGGALLHHPALEQVGVAMAEQAKEPGSLAPQHFSLYVDQRYILSAMGLLARSHPSLAMKIMTKELKQHADS